METVTSEKNKIQLASKERKDSQLNLTRIYSDKNDVSNKLNRQVDYKSILFRRISDLEAKEKNIEKSIAETATSWIEKQRNFRKMYIANKAATDSKNSAITTENGVNSNTPLSRPDGVISSLNTAMEISVEDSGSKETDNNNKKKGFWGIGQRLPNKGPKANENLAGNGNNSTMQMGDNSTNSMAVASEDRSSPSLDNGGDNEPTIHELREKLMKNYTNRKNDSSDVLKSESFSNNTNETVIKAYSDLDIQGFGLR